MDLVNGLLNLVAPPFTFFTLLLFLPPWTFFNFCFSILRTFVFSENISRKVVLITGASSGIGEHLAYEYASRGACLSLAARREDRLRQVADRCLEIGSPDVIVIPADVSNAHDCKRMVDQTVHHFHRLDHLVNNAGISQVCMLEEAEDITNLRPVMDINFWGSVYTTRFAAPHLRNCGGRIIVLSSAASWIPLPRMSLYNMQVNLSPVGKVEVTARAIVKQALRGDRYVTEPSWMKMSYVWKVMWPEVVEWVNRLMCITTIGGESGHDTFGKRVMDVVGGRSILYPTSIQSSSESSEMKSD